MTKKALLQQVQAATKEEQKLIERILTSPTSIKLTLIEALSEIAKPTTRSKFLQYVLEAAVAVSREAQITADANLDERHKGFEAMVEVFTRPEALKALAPTGPPSSSPVQGSASQTRVVIWRRATAHE